MKLDKQVSLDIGILTLPLILFNISEGLLDFFAYTLLALSIITIVGIGVMKANSLQALSLLREQRDRPLWWPSYDVLMTMMITVTWAIFDYWYIGFGLILSKIVLWFKEPEYFSGYFWNK